MMHEVYAVRELYVTTGDDVVDTIDDVKTSLHKEIEEAEEHLENLLHSYTIYVEDKLGINLDDVTDDDVKIDFDKEKGHLKFYCYKGNCYLEASILKMKCEFIDRTTKDK